MAGGCGQKVIIYLTDHDFPGKDRNEKTKPSKPQSEEYARFEKLARQLLAVPKSEIDKRHAQYEKKKPLRNERLRNASIEGKSPKMRNVINTLILALLLPSTCFPQQKVISRVPVLRHPYYGPNVLP
ncbi:MAG TPA: hypothetical protein VFP47_11155, partial [Pyrinomonadaceae bacterium]|nr:hypothetical protein [Pyrinomonadaceae bacterium]